MVRSISLAAFVFATVTLSGCSKAPVPPPKITQFKADPTFLPTGVVGKLCYGVENATKLELTPHVEAVLPASEHCIDIAPKQTTTYTLTAFGAGPEDKQSLEVKVGAPPPRVADLTARPMEVKRGGRVRVCFKVENAKSVRVKPGKLDRRTNCLTDYPRKTTTYRVTALGPDREEDSGTVTVQVRR
jgi:hypothetical protein